MKAKRRGIVFLEGSTYQFSLSEIKIAKEDYGLYVAFVSQEGLIEYAEEAKKNLVFADRHITVKDLMNIEEIKRALPNDVDFVASTSFTEEGILPSAKLAKLLDIDTAMSVNTAMVCRNKLLQRQIALDTLFKQPKHLLIELERFTSIEDFPEINLLEYPLIVKPYNGVGSYKVKKVFSRVELENYILQLKTEELMIPFDHILVEEFINGELISIEALSCRGEHRTIGITSKILGGENGFVAIGGTFPATVSGFHKHLIDIGIAQLLDKLDFKNGAMHIEAILNNEGIYLVEINGRLAGAYVPQMINFAYECNIVSEVLSILVNGSFNKEIFRAPKMFSTLRAFYSNTDGVFLDVLLPKSVDKNTLPLFKLRQKIGSPVKHLKDTTDDRIGFFIVNEANEEASIRKADELFKAIQVIVR